MNQEQLKEAKAYIGRFFIMGRGNGKTLGMRAMYAIAYALNKAIAEPAKQQNGRTYCPSCGSRIRQKDKYCRVCGQRVTQKKEKTVRREYER